MIRFFIALFVATVFGSVLSAAPAGALSLKVAPLEYRTTLAKGEKKKGFIDISNPTGQSVAVKTSVEGFKQYDDKGSLMFFKSDQLNAGVLLDLKTFKLGPRQAVRMYFVLDGKKLPPGDVFGAIFFTVEPSTTTNGIGQAVRLGTLLSIVNGTPGERKAEITSVEAPLFQFDTSVSGKYTIKNKGDPAKSSGFYPEVTIRSWPSGKKETVTGSLIFAGRERSNAFVAETGVGIHIVEAAYGGSKKSRLVITITPLVAVILLLIVAIIATEFALLKRRRAISKSKPLTPAK